MKKKLISMLAAGSLLLPYLPVQRGFAAEEYPAVKFGVSAGDTVLFGSGAGNEDFTAPARLVVLDPDKTNSDDETGMFLIAAENEKTTKSSEFALSSDLDAACQAYLAQFSEEEKAAIPAITKIESWLVGSASLNENITDAQVFLLSHDEVESYQALIPSQPDWWLRSKGYDSMLSRDSIGYVGEDGTAKSKSVSSILNVGGFRPGMNLEKGRVEVGTDFGNQILLLPATLGGAFSAVSTSAEKPDYRLAVWENNAVLPGAVTIDKRSYSFPVTASENPGENEYISVLVTDGKTENPEVLAYGSFPETDKTMNISLTLPDGIDQNSCKMYVFHEKAGAVGDLFEVCTKHEWLYTDAGNTQHDMSCAKCGYTTAENHQYQMIDDTAHGKECIKCGHQGNGKHSIKYQPIDAENHKVYCSECDYESQASHQLIKLRASTTHEDWCQICDYRGASEPHQYRYEYVDRKYHRESCTGCSTTGKEKHRFIYVKQEDGSWQYTCSVCQLDLGIRAYGGKQTSGYLERSNVIDAESIQCLKGNVTVPYEQLFTADGTTCTINADEGASSTELNLKLQTKYPVTIRGVYFQTDGNSGTDATHDLQKLPERIELLGYAEDGTEEALAVLEPGELLNQEDQSGCTYLFQDAKQYKSYGIRMTSQGASMQLGALVPLTATGREVEFSLLGVIAETEHDYLIPGEDYECTLISENGHPKKDEVWASADNAAFTEYTYSEETGLLHIDGDKIPADKLYIDAYASYTSRKVSVNRSSLTTKGAVSAVFGMDYKMILRAKSDELHPTKSDITVTIGGVDYTGFRYDRSTGELVIPGKDITGDIEVTAFEHGILQSEESVISVRNQYGEVRYYDDAETAAAAANNCQEAEMTLLKDVLTGSLTLKNSKIMVNLNGHTLDFGTPNTPLEITDRADVTFYGGGTLDLHTNYNVYIGDAKASFLDVQVLLSYNCICIKKDGVMVVDGAEFESYGDDNIYVLDWWREKLIVKNGSFSGYIASMDENSLIELSGGRFAKLYVADYTQDFFSMLQDGYAFKNTKDEIKTLEDKFFDINIVTDVEVVPSPFGACREEELHLPAQSEAVLSADMDGDGLSYQWFLNGRMIDGATEKTYTIPSGTAEGNYVYVCAVSDGTHYAACKRASVIVGEVKPVAFCLERDDYFFVDTYGRLGTAIIVGYDENGRMVDFASIPMTTKRLHESRSLSRTFGMPQCASYKMFAWDSIDSMHPIEYVIEVL